MSSTDELLREIEESGGGSTTQSDAQSTGTETKSRRARLTDTVSQMFSPRSFLVSLVLISIGLFIPSFIPFVSALPGIGFIGVFLAAFALGVLSSEQRYLEIGVAGAVASGVGAFLSSPLLAVGRLGIEFVGAGAVVGALAALLGCYFGRDLRGGLTKEIE